MPARTTPCHRSRGLRKGLRRLPAQYWAVRCGGAPSSLPLADPDALVPQKQRATDCSAALYYRLRRKKLLQIGHRGQVGRELDDAGRAAPVRTSAARIDRCDIGCSGGIEGTGERAAITLRQVGVGVAKVQREHLVSETDANVPGVVAGVGDACRESRAGAGAVEPVGCPKPLTTDFAGDIHADATLAEDSSWRRVLGGDRRIVAPGAGVQEARCVKFGEAELPVVIDRVISLAVDLEEADVLLQDVAVGNEDGVGADRANTAAGDATGKGVAVGTTPARIEVAPDTNVEGEGTEGRSNTAVDIDFGRGTICKRDALAADANVELQVLVDVISWLEIGGDRWLGFGWGEAG